MAVWYAFAAVYTALVAVSLAVFARRRHCEPIRSRLWQGSIVSAFFGERPAAAWRRAPELCQAARRRRARDRGAAHG